LGLLLAIGQYCVVMSLQLHNIHHSYGRHAALADISLSLNDGEILCVIGPSGSGKSTLLRTVAGLERLQQGKILLDGECIAQPNHSPPPERRPVGLVFQDHALFPHLTVAENVGFGLNHLTPAGRQQQVDELLQSVDLLALGARYPATLSGGQQQRVALVRALATKPRVMLLDEPFASVDTPLRRQLRQDARQSLKRSGTTAIVVTHDPEEAMAMADRILVLVDGIAVQFDTPQALWQHPAHRFVAETIAGLQSLIGVVAAEHVTTAFGNLPRTMLENSEELDVGREITLGIRGNAISIEQDAKTGAAAIVRDIRFDGIQWTAVIEPAIEPAGGTASAQLSVVVADAHTLQVGSAVTLSFTATTALVYN
jgi:iron(III) transport system ATP-binding protein